MPQLTGSVVQGTGEVPVLYVALSFSADRKKIQKAVNSLQIQLPVLKSVEIFLVPAMYHHPNYRAKAAYLFGLPLGEEQLAIDILVNCLKTVFPGIELSRKSNMCASHARKYAMLIMDFRNTER